MEQQERITILIKQLADDSMGKVAYAELMQYLKAAKNDDDSVYTAMDEVWGELKGEET